MKKSIEQPPRAETFKRELARELEKHLGKVPQKPAKFIAEKQQEVERLTPTSEVIAAPTHETEPSYTTMIRSVLDRHCAHDCAALTQEQQKYIATEGWKVIGQLDDIMKNQAFQADEQTMEKMYTAVTVWLKQIARYTEKSSNGEEYNAMQKADNIINEILEERLGVL